MGETNFERLDVFRLAESLADMVWRMVAGWGAFERGTVGAQVVRAADSVGANIAEGKGRGTHADNRRFIRIARGSLYETKYWLRRAHRRGLMARADANRIQPLLDELLPRLNSYHHAISKKAARRP